MGDSLLHIVLPSFVYLNWDVLKKLNVDINDGLNEGTFKGHLFQ